MQYLWPTTWGLHRHAWLAGTNGNEKQTRSDREPLKGIKRWYEVLRNPDSNSISETVLASEEKFLNMENLLRLPSSDET